MENSEIQAPSYTMHRTQTKNIDYRDTGTIVHNAQNTNQEWRIQRYRQHRAQYTERTQTKNGNSRDTGSIVRNTQNEHKPKVNICLTTNYVEIIGKYLLQFPDSRKNMAYHRLAYMSNKTGVTSRTGIFLVIVTPAAH